MWLFIFMSDCLFEFCSYKLFMSYRWLNIKLWVRLRLSFVICHFLFFISHLSYKAKTFDKSFKGVKNVYYQYYKSFTCDENVDKKTLFFLQVQFLKILFFSGSVFELISQQPWKHKAAAATLISNHKLQNNCSFKKCISEYKCKNYVNSCEFIWICR